MRRLRTLTLWTGTLLSLLIAAAFVVSARWQLAFQVPTSRGPAMIVMAGSVMLANDELMSVAVSAATRRWGLDRCNSWAADRITIVQGPASRPTTLVMLEFPLYVPFLNVLLPTLLVLRFVPKFPRGHCRRCGYNLTGLTEARCPECGDEFENVRVEQVE